jgi:hypothetical protein
MTEIARLIQEREERLARRTPEEIRRERDELRRRINDARFDNSPSLLDTLKGVWVEGFDPDEGIWGERLDDLQGFDPDEGTILAAGE